MVNLLFSGIGYTMITLSLVVAVYYNVILALTFFYFFASVYGLFHITKASKKNSK